MYTARQSAIAVGVFFLITHVTSVLAAFVFYAPVLADPGFALDGVSPAGVRFGGLLDVLLALAVVGTSVAAYPIVKPVSEGFAMGYVALRTLEAGVILIGVVLLMAATTLHGTSSLDIAKGFVSVTN